MKDNLQSKQNNQNVIYIIVGIIVVAALYISAIFGPLRTYTNSPIKKIFIIGVPSLFILGIVGRLIWKTDEPVTETLKDDSLNDEFLKNSFVLDAMTDSLIVLDEKNVIVAFNKAAATLTEWPVDEALGLDYRSVLQLTDPKNAAITNQDLISQSLTQNKTVKQTVNLVTKNKKDKLISLNVSPILNGEGRSNGALVVFRDVTDENKIQQQKADFVSTASHEMRTPIAAIEGYLALAMNGSVSTIDDRARDYLNKAHASTETLGKLFRDLLTSEKADDGRLISKPQVVEMGEFLNTIVDNLKFLAQKKALNVEYTIGANKVIDTTNEPQHKVLPPLYYAYVDPDRLKEVVTNLFDNAVKYTEKGKITVGLTADDQNIQFYVKDTGIGISQEDLPHIFQKFYRVDSSSTRVIGGTGLGLFIAQKMIEICKGKLWVESEEGKGSTFFVNLPRMSKQRVELLQKAAAKQPNPIAKTQTTS